MASRCYHLMKGFSRRNSFCSISIRQNYVSHHIPPTKIELHQIKRTGEHITENNLNYLEDPDTFGTLSSKSISKPILQDKGDIQEEEFLKNVPLKSQKLTIKQYADIIKQYLQHKRLKEAIDILEVRMLKEDRVKPENYIYNILIGACAEFGYTKKAFKLFNDMKKRGLKTTGDTYTCLFEACINSPYKNNALKQTTHLRNLMIEKGIEPNVTNYNVMIKAFGRCGDLPKAFQIVDEMVSKNIKIRVHTINHLLHACISDKESGLRHALIVWRKMLQLREKPNIYSFNLMLKCVKECNLGSNEDIQEIINIIQENALLNDDKLKKQLFLNSAENFNEPNENKLHKNQLLIRSLDDNSKEIAVSNPNLNLTLIDKTSLPATPKTTVPNLLAKHVNLNQVCGLREVHTVHDKFAIVGGQDDFIQYMKANMVHPDLKTFTQMLDVIENNTEAENKLLQTMKSLNIKVDIAFYNMLIKKRCLRLDYDSAFEVKDMIENENKLHKGHPFNKKKMLKFNIMTYGTLAMACKTKEQAVNLLNEMEGKQLKVNITILGTLLRHGTAHMQFGYIVYIMNLVRDEKIQINDVFLKHLESFNEKCKHIIEKKDQKDSNFILAYNKFNKYYYQNWLKEVNKEVVNVKDSWQQFKESYPTPVQNESFQIVEPRRFYKRERRFHPPYSPRI